MVTRVQSPTPMGPHCLQIITTTPDVIQPLYKTTKLNHDYFITTRQCVMMEQVHQTNLTVKLRVNWHYLIGCLDIPLSIKHERVFGEKLYMY